ncbi:invasion associated locus B family protein [uncultured Alsobacter sp.]|uniref:invasion associated locus B family protein n=1 Tax=uncultured Alsobacter sp. TaxID=1748258 RepID=UPI0025CCF091|nr:invasion associated locus B family protein [uncultured Alsobacter sp.]
MASRPILPALAFLGAWPALAAVTPAQAQTAPAPAPAAPAAAAVSADPQVTTATYGDWVLRCTRTGEGAQAQRLCEIVQTLQAQGQQAIVAQIAFGRLSAKDPLKLTILLPVNASFPGSVRMGLDEKDAGAQELGWRRCLPMGCFADAEPKDDMLKRWRGQSGNAVLLYKDGTGRDVVLPMSMRGLAQALDNLPKG